MKNMRLSKIVLSLTLVGALSYSCSETTEQQTTSTDSVTVACDSTCVSDSCSKNDSVCVDSVK
jgi:hypothetical protein